MNLSQLKRTARRTARIADYLPIETDATINVRLLSPGEQRDVANMLIETVFVPDDEGKIVPEMRQNLPASNIRLYQLATDGWDGISMDGETPLVCNKDGKHRLMDALPDIVDLVVKIHGEMAREVEEGKAEQVKN